ncbi:hypothetical protein B10525_06220 [Campylobacter jejuni]|nr:hypothetical protein B10525_06220 [Campylobacter jejuni]
MELSLRMKEYREYFGWTQTDLSEKSGVSISTIKKYEAGSVDNFTYGNLKKLLQLLIYLQLHLLVKICPTIVRQYLTKYVRQT